jgi:hypothetical protein
VKAPANCRLIGRWRIVEADIWDRACEGTAELLDDGTLEIEFEYRNGDPPQSKTGAFFNSLLVDKI